MDWLSTWRSTRLSRTYAPAAQMHEHLRILKRHGKLTHCLFSICLVNLLIQVFTCSAPSWTHLLCPGQPLQTPHSEGDSQCILDPGLFPRDLCDWGIDFWRGGKFHMLGQATKYSSGQLSVLLPGPLLRVALTISSNPSLFNSTRKTL